MTEAGAKECFRNWKCLPKILDISNNLLKKEGTYYIGRALEHSESKV